MKKTLLTLLALVLVAVISVSGTLAWLTATTPAVENTFTVGDINITLDESDNLDLKMVPGKTLDKDPAVTVAAGSEDCYVFVKVEESSNFDEFMEYTIADGWTALDGEDGVYYRLVSDITGDETFSVLKDDSVTVKEDVTKEALNELTADTLPKLTFTGYAVQSANGTGTFTAAEAFAKLS